MIGTNDKSKIRKNIINYYYKVFNDKSILEYFPDNKVDEKTFTFLQNNMIEPFDDSYFANFDSLFKDLKNNKFDWTVIFKLQNLITNFTGTILDYYIIQIIKRDCNKFDQLFFMGAAHITRINEYFTSNPINGFELIDTNRGGSPVMVLENEIFKKRKNRRRIRRYISLCCYYCSNCTIVLLSK